jgi:hypothetical protein
MIANSVSPDAKENAAFKPVDALKNETNREWLKRVQKDTSFGTSGLLLIGGNSVTHFRIRTAQSHLRRDLMPSYWSLVGILSSEKAFFSAPLDWKGKLSKMPFANGIQSCKLSDYDDPARFPNIAVIQFARTDESILEYAKRLQLQRSVIDLPALIISWLEYVWAVGKKGNPLTEGHGLPSAVFAETVFGIAGIELTPGLATASSCPEAIWQSARWWKSFYEETSKVNSESQVNSIVPKGYFALRQPAAAVNG